MPSVSDILPSNKFPKFRKISCFSSSKKNRKSGKTLLAKNGPYCGQDEVVSETSISFGSLTNDANGKVNVWVIEIFVVPSWTKTEKRHPFCILIWNHPASVVNCFDQKTNHSGIYLQQRQLFYFIFIFFVALLSIAFRPMIRQKSCPQHRFIRRL